MPLAFTYHWYESVPVVGLVFEAVSSTSASGHMVASAIGVRVTAGVFTVMVTALEVAAQLVPRAAEVSVISTT